MQLYEKAVFYDTVIFSNSPLFTARTPTTRTTTYSYVYSYDYDYWSGAEIAGIVFGVLAVIAAVIGLIVRSSQASRTPNRPKLSVPMAGEPV